MSPPDTDALYRVLRAADPDVMDSDELVALTSQIAQLKSLVRFAAGTGHAPPASPGCGGSRGRPAQHAVAARPELVEGRPRGERT